MTSAVERGKRVQTVLTGRAVSDGGALEEDVGVGGERRLSAGSRQGGRRGLVLARAMACSPRNVTIRRASDQIIERRSSSDRGTRKWKRSKEVGKGKRCVDRPKERRRSDIRAKGAGFDGTGQRPLPTPQMSPSSMLTA